MNKDLIRERFSKTLKSYNDNAKIQKRMAERLISFCEKKEYSKILEIGCGTGFLTHQINNSFKFQQYQALDIVEDCKEYIKNINEKIEFISEDIEEFIVNNKENYDLIISNASLQWVNDFENVINKLKSKLNPDGELIFSTFGKENFREIFHIIGTGLEYFSINELQEKITNSKIEQEIHIMAFQSAKEVLRHLQLTGVNAIEKQSWTKKNLIDFENAYNNICSKRPMLTYNPIYIHTRK